MKCKTCSTKLAPDYYISLGEFSEGVVTNKNAFVIVCSWECARDAAAAIAKTRQQEVSK